MKVRMKSSGGGGLTETVLWENPNPTANYAGQTQSLDAGKKISDYDYIKFVYKYASTNTDDIEITVPRTQFEKTLSSDSVTGPALFFGIRNSANTRGYRAVFYSSDTAVQFGSAYLINSSTAYQNFALPYKIIGMK